MNGSLRALIVAALVAIPRVVDGAAPPNPIHPTFEPLDAQGRPTREATQVSTDRTCGACHDAVFVRDSGGHDRAHATVGCDRCHAEGGRLEVGPASLDEQGKLVRSALRLGAPQPSNCAGCHGVATESREPVSLPPAFDAGATPGLRQWTLTLGEGALVSGEKIAESLVNVQGKQELSVPWDVHAARLVGCAQCHYARNDPAHPPPRREALGYLENDPRRASIAEFLARPDHRLTAAGCRGCHDARAAHAFLPYRARHMEVLACETCHVATVRGPIAEMIDETVLTAAGGAPIRFRNVVRVTGEPINAALVQPFRPLLVEGWSEGARRLRPVNLVTRYRWRAANGPADVPAATLAAAFLIDGRYAPAILAGFDRNGDGALDDAELRLDTPEKTKLVEGRLAALGVAQPTIEGRIEVQPISHGIGAKSTALRECDGCHAEGARLQAGISITPYTPGDVAPTPPSGAAALPGQLAPSPGGGLALRRTQGSPGARLHVLGATHDGLSNRLGFYLFLAVFLGVSGHGLGRVLLARRTTRSRSPAAPATEKVRVFATYERLWHWTMAASGLALILTGLGIHNAGAPWMGSLPTVVLVHNVAAVLLTVNAFLSLFYHLATLAIRSFIPDKNGLAERVREHVLYQAIGIFRGAPHPHQGRDEKLNPLQQLTYLALLNILFPLQIVTGALLWAIGRWPTLGASLGGLSVVAPIHNFGAWTFLSFFALHVYLVTTGRTVGEHLQSMVTGYRDVELEENPHEGV